MTSYIKMKQILGMSLGVGGFPWIALTLAGSFGVYGLIKKKMEVEPITSFTVESLGMLVWVGVGSFFLDWSFYQGSSHNSPWLFVLVISTGIATAVPLILYNIGVRLIPLGMIGMLQFIAPTLKFLIGIAVFGEPFGAMELFGFLCIWAGVLLYVLQSIKGVKTSISINSGASSEV